MPFIVSERRPTMAPPISRRPAGRIHRFFLGSRVPSAPAHLTPLWAAVWVILRVVRRLTLGDHVLAVRLALTFTVVIAVVVVAGSLLYVGLGISLGWGVRHR